MLPPGPPAPLGHWCGGAWLCSESRASPQRACTSGRPHVHTAGGFSSASPLPKGNSASESETRWLQRLHLRHPPDTPSCPPGPGRASSRCCNTCSDSCATRPLRPSLERGSVSMERLPSSLAQIQGLDLVPCWDPCEAMPLQGDLVEQGCDPPQFLPCLGLGVPPPSPCAGFGGAPVVAVTQRTLWMSVPLAQLACAIVLGHCSLLHCHAGQLSILCHWRWISSSWLPPVPFSTPLVLCCCDSGAGSGSSGWLGAGVPHCV